MTRSTTPAQPATAPIERLIPISELIAITSLSKATIYRMIADRCFPAPLKIGRSRVAWKAADVIAWQAAQARASVRASQAA